MKVLIGPNPMALQDAIPELQGKYPQLNFSYCADRELLAQAIADADIYMGWMNRDLFLAAKNLKWVQSPSSGINYYLDIPEFVTSSTLLTSARGTHAGCLAESTMGMILAFNRGIRGSILHQRDHHWAGRELRPGMLELRGSTMGIIGLGAVGCTIAERAAPFGMRIIACDLFPPTKPACVESLGGLDQLDELLRQSDYVVVTVPWTAQTKDMIGAKQIALMKPTAMLIGISRGGIINQDALIAALREGRLRAAALDVCHPEPLPPDSELWDLDNLLLTPHIAGGTQFEGEYILDIFRENLGRFVSGNLPLRNQIDKARGF